MLPAGVAGGRPNLLSLSALIVAPSRSLRQTWRQRKRARQGMPAAPRLLVRLENELAAKLEGSRILCTSHESEVAVGCGVVERVELRVVEGVEAVCAHLEVSPFGECKGLVNRSGEVGAAGADNGISTFVAKAQVRTACPRRYRS